jgi:hypothetical protein
MMLRFFFLFSFFFAEYHAEFQFRKCLNMYLFMLYLEQAFLSTCNHSHVHVQWFDVSIVRM